jgi:hypothetical protein
MAPPLALIDATAATSGRSVRCRDLGTRKTTQLTTAASVTNGLNTLPEYVGSVGKYSCRGRLRGLDDRLTGFGFRELRGAQGGAVISRSVIPVPAAVSSAVRRGSKADPAGPALAKAIDRWLSEFSVCLVGHVLDCALGIANGLLSITLCLTAQRLLHAACRCQ